MCSVCGQLRERMDGWGGGRGGGGEAGVWRPEWDMEGALLPTALSGTGALG